VELDSMISLEHLNMAPHDEAWRALLTCCGSKRWAQLMVEARPFASLAALEEAADRIWQELGPEDWLEAFSSHPKIGARQAERPQSKQSSQWSAQEQSGTHQSATETLSALAESNNEYERRFGYIFIVCATGKSGEEMLALCQRRLTNEPEKELPVAAEEQRLITRIRLRKLIGSTA
jgi:OHCU decarboxylase